MSTALPVANLDESRLRRFRQTSDRRVRSMDEAVEFVDDVGLCVFQGERGNLPSFYGAIAGRSGPAPRWGEHDGDYGRAWEWKDRLFSQKRFYYGKALGDFRMMVSRALLPYLHAACAPGPTVDDDDYLALYEDGLLGNDAKQVYETLLALGAASTTRLRDGAHMRGKGDEWRRFEKALSELQRAFLVAPIGIARDNRWKYTFKYAPLHVAFPKESKRSTELSSRAAMAYLLRHYVDLVGPATLGVPARLFGWTTERLERVARSLHDEGLLVLDGSGQRALLSPTSSS